MPRLLHSCTRSTPVRQPHTCSLNSTQAALMIERKVCCSFCQGGDPPLGLLQCILEHSLLRCSIKRAPATAVVREKHIEPCQILLPPPQATQGLFVTPVPTGVKQEQDSTNTNRVRSKVKAFAMDRASGHGVTPYKVAVTQGARGMQGRGKQETRH